MPNEISVKYDRMADVLYISLGDPRPAYSDENDGIDYRFDEYTDDPCGATVDGLMEYWSDRGPELASRIAHFLHVDKSLLIAALSRASVQSARFWN